MAPNRNPTANVPDPSGPAFSAVQSDQAPIAEGRPRCLHVEPSQQSQQQSYYRMTVGMLTGPGPKCSSKFEPRVRNGRRAAFSRTPISIGLYTRDAYHSTVAGQGHGWLPIPLDEHRPALEHSIRDRVVVLISFATSLFFATPFLACFCTACHNSSRFSRSFSGQSSSLPRISSREVIIILRVGGGAKLIVIRQYLRRPNGGRAGSAGV